VSLKAVLAAAALSIAACGAKPEAPPAAPQIAAPADAVPPDLDVVVRIDVAGLREAIGATAFALLSARAKQSAAGMDPGSQRMIVDLLGQADTLWLAFRPGLDLDHTDNVVVLRGRFERLDPRDYRASPAWQSATDLGAGWRVFERPRPRSRSAPARVIQRGGDLVVLVSYAEIDAVERGLEGRQSSSAVAPPETGSFSVAARVRPLAASMATRSPAAARLLGQATTLEASLSLAATGMTARLSVDFEMDDQARRAADAANLLLRALAEQSTTLAELLPSLRVEAVGASVVVSANIDRERLAALAACALAETCG
jgi:hypothetical protein